MLTNRWKLLLASLLLLAHSYCFAQLTLNTGMEWTNGDYGRSRSTDELRVPFGARYAWDRWTFRAILPFSQVEGFANANQREITGSSRLTGGSTATPGGGTGSGAGIEDDDDLDDDDPSTAVSPVSSLLSVAPVAGATVGSGGSARQQSGVGDLLLSAFYGLLSPKDYWLGLDLGVRAKVPLAGGSQCLITNGAFDLSFEAYAYKPVGRFEPSLVFGWTKRGDPDRRDLDCQISGDRLNLRDPFYIGPGIGYDITESTGVEVRYLYREKLLADSDPFKELRLTLRHRLTPNWQLGGFGLLGFSNSSPDWGLGATVGYRF